MKITWNVRPVGYQLISKRCPACHGQQDFTPSGAFRVNSQKKVLDVWSIYKCVRCAYTWNISLFSRLPVSKINPQLYARLIANDKSAVEAYSHDPVVLRRNRAALSGTPDFVVQERWRINLVRASQVRVDVRVTRAFQTSLLSVLRRALRLSGSAIRQHHEGGSPGAQAYFIKRGLSARETIAIAPDSFLSGELTRKNRFGLPQGAK